MPIGCPKGTPENQKGLSDQNLQALRHYQECKAVGSFPDDPIVRRNARIISQMERQHERQERSDFESELLDRLDGIRKAVVLRGC